MSASRNEHEHEVRILACRTLQARRTPAGRKITGNEGSNRQNNTGSGDGGRKKQRTGTEDSDRQNCAGSEEAANFDYIRFPFLLLGQYTYIIKQILNSKV
jgi:hypothetical protein